MADLIDKGKATDEIEAGVIDEIPSENGKVEDTTAASPETDQKPLADTTQEMVKSEGEEHTDVRLTGKEPDGEDTPAGQDPGGVGTGEVDDLETFNPQREPPVDDNARNELFNKGVKYDQDGKKGEALKCYLRCLVGLKENSRFALLPQCLRNIGDIYYGRNEYEKAISFIQAEKLYYESVLIDDTELQRHIDDVTAEGASKEGGETNIDVLRATEYEQLAKFCLEEKQPQLALEYAGKATKLRQKVYGDGHPVVQQTLDFFATIYAEVGKVQYTESMGKYDPSAEPGEDGDPPGETTPTQPSEPTSILRKRKNTEGETEKRVRFDESQLRQEEESMREEKCARLVLTVLFFALFLVLIVLGLYIYCTLNQTTACKSFRRLIFDAVMRLRYLYYHYTTSAKDVQYG